MRTTASVANAKSMMRFGTEAALDLEPPEAQAELGGVVAVEAPATMTSEEEPAAADFLDHEGFGTTFGVVAGYLEKLNRQCYQYFQ